MERSTIFEIAAVGAAALFFGHLAMQVLPVSLAGLPTQVVVLCAMAGSVAAAIRWL